MKEKLDLKDLLRLSLPPGLIKQPDNHGFFWKYGARIIIENMKIYRGSQFYWGNGFDWGEEEYLRKALLNMPHDKYYSELLNRGITNVLYDEFINAYNKKWRLFDTCTFSEKINKLNHSIYENYLDDVIFMYFRLYINQEVKLNNRMVNIAINKACQSFGDMYMKKYKVKHFYDIPELGIKFYDSIIKNFFEKVIIFKKSYGLISVEKFNKIFRDRKDRNFTIADCNV